MDNKGSHRRSAVHLACRRGGATAHAVLAFMVVVALAPLAACGESGPPGAKSPVPGVTLTASSPAPSPPASHVLSKGEKHALARVVEIFNKAKSPEEKEHFRGYEPADARIIGYLVQSKAPAFSVAFLVTSRTGQVRTAGPQFGFQTWAMAEPEGEGESWAVAVVDHTLNAVMDQLRIDELERGICGYVVGWPPSVGDLTMWIDLKGDLRGGSGIP